MEYQCSDCPRRCGALRTDVRGSGYCRAPALPHVIRAAAHFGEEPCISGSRGAGTVFFTGCSLRCVFCQNREISAEGFGREISVERLGEIFLELHDPLYPCHSRGAFQSGAFDSGGLEQFRI